MLKWAVGYQRKGDESTTCCRPPFRKTRRRSAGKENSECRGNEGSPRTRDSVYMRLEAVPAALRDVSNYRLEETPPRTPQSLRHQAIRTGVKRPRKWDPQGCRSPREKKKQPCVEKHDFHDFGKFGGWMSASKLSLDSEKSTVQIEYSPGALRNAVPPSLLGIAGESPPTSLYFVTNNSPSPIELDHKEIPLSQEDKETILNTPVNRRGAAVRREIARRLWDASSPLSAQFSPLARSFNFLHLSGAVGPNSNKRTSSELSLSPVPFTGQTVASGKPAFLLSPYKPDIIKECVQTNNDRNSNSLSLNSVNNNVNKLDKGEDERNSKRRCVVFNEDIYELNSSICCDEEERESTSFATSVDLDAPSELKRQKAIRRRRPKEEKDERPANKIMRRSCLTLPDGIPSPFESPAFVARLSRPLPPPSKLVNDNQSACKRISSPCDEEVTGVRPLDASPPPTEYPVDERRFERPNSLCSDITWDSHRMNFLRTPKLTSAHILHDATLTEMSATPASASSSKIEDDEDAVSSLGSTSLTERSPLPMVDGQSRSRRCLTFTSPSVKGRNRSQHKRLAGSHKLQQGELEINIYYNSGMLTIHIVRGKNLQPASGIGSCNAYIKVSMVPNATERTFYRTCVKKDSNNPRFDTKFSLELTEADQDRRVLVSAWHRDRGNKKSEFLGCMSFAVKNVIRKEVNGTFRLLSQSCGRIKNVPIMTNSEILWHQQTEVMANQSESSVEELLSIDDSEVAQPVETAKEKRRKASKKEMERVQEDHMFLRHLELDPPEEVCAGSPPSGPSGRTPFTTTRTLNRQHGSSYGFSIAWTHPPRIERVEAGLPAEQAGLRPGDFVIFVGKTNVVTLQEEEILQLIKSCGTRLILEVYRKTPSSRGQLIGGVQQRSSTACSAATTTATAASLELVKRRLHLPQVTFNSESNVINEEECRKRSVYQLLGKEQQYALCLQFGIARFLLPLSERKDLISPAEHAVLFQNAQELLRHTEDILELYVQDETLGQSLGRIYHKKLNGLSNAYKRYCVGLKKADCLLVEKTRNPGFMKLITEPPVPRRRPDLTTFIHKPLEHYREVLKLLQTTLNITKTKDEDYIALSKVVHEMQAAYREITVESGLMEPDGEGRPLLSLQDLESRLVFTRCKPFVLSSPGRQWIFGGDLSRVEGRSVRPFWALLFTDLLMFAKVSRDRVIFVTEEPLSLSQVSQALFSIRKKATEFRLLVSNSTPGEESPAVGGCADLQLSRTPRKGPRRRTVALRAPTPELKAVWQNLIQRQIIYVNTGRGGTPASSPMDSPDPLTADSMETISTKRQTESRQATAAAIDLIEHRCRQLGKSGVSKGSALHLAQWMRGQLGGEGSPETESEPEIWSPDTLRRRAANLHGKGGAQPLNRSISRCEEVEISDFEQSTSDSQMTVRSTEVNSEKLMAVCRKCHKTCLLNNRLSRSNMTVDVNANQACRASVREDVQVFSDESNWGSGGGQLGGSVPNLSPTDPFLPVPHISVQPPTPTTAVSGIVLTSNIINNNSNNNLWDEEKQINGSNLGFPSIGGGGETDEGGESDGEIEEPPYRSLSPCGLKRYGTVSSLERLDESGSVSEEEDDTSKEQEELPQDSTQQYESVSQSIRGWTVRAGTFVVEKMAFFERITDDGKGVSFIDRYIRAPADHKHSEELIATTTTLAGEDECETSGGTSGEEVWGTPTSGDSGLTSPNTEYADTVGTALDDAREQLMLDRLLSGMSIMGSLVPLCPVSRGFPQRRRLDPLPEDEEDTSESTSLGANSDEEDDEEATKSFSTDQ
ncbi:protostome-specific GEF isoform X3 [Rhodnius prolixus]